MIEGEVDLAGHLVVFDFDGDGRGHAAVGHLVAEEAAGRAGVGRDGDGCECDLDVCGGGLFEGVERAGEGELAAVVDFGGDVDLGGVLPEVLKGAAVTVMSSAAMTVAGVVGVEEASVSSMLLPVISKRSRLILKGMRSARVSLRRSVGAGSLVKPSGGIMGGAALKLSASTLTSAAAMDLSAVLSLSVLTLAPATESAALPNFSVPALTAEAEASPLRLIAGSEPGAALTARSPLKSAAPTPAVMGPKASLALASTLPREAAPV